MALGAVRTSHNDGARTSESAGSAGKKKLYSLLKSTDFHNLKYATNSIPIAPAWMLLGRYLDAT
ncbi:MAG: hypothetical protein LBE09_01180 [Christensenellaceae bacterium]|nr:hypothetical protein [Christensenellaceae bacterium]